VWALRELEEETGLAAPASACRLLPVRYSPDKRASGEAWIVTAPVHIDLGTRTGLPALTPRRGEVRAAAWIPADTFERLTDALREEHGGRVWPTHTRMLAEFTASRATRAPRRPPARPRQHSPGPLELGG
jgi:ADP-ribose pyrophosphatase